MGMYSQIRGINGVDVLSNQEVEMAPNQILNLSYYVNYDPAVGSGDTSENPQNYDIDISPVTGTTGVDGDIVVLRIPESFSLLNTAAGGTGEFLDQDAIAVQLLTYREGAKYSISIGNFSTPMVIASTTTVAAVPEFPTIALPVAAVLGLIFIFGRKKEGL